MKHTQKEELFIRQNPLTDQLFDGNSIFFDIETTGFSPAQTSLYMIGCARRSGKYVCVDQFFAESPAEEKLIISSFLEILKQYDTIISFNGIGFDIPYLKAKCDQHGLSESFSRFNYLDIFKSVSRLKFLLKLPNYKQKTIESFLGLPRNDEQTGGELINVYLDYVNHPSDEALRLLHLHNYEDVLRMVDLLPIMSYIELFNGQYTILSTRTDIYHGYDGSSGEELIINLQNDFPVPKRISCRFGDFSLMIGKTRSSIRIRIYNGELRYFFKDYKNYYYLPVEDMAVHKSVSSYVNKNYREQAIASNCYLRKASRFLPQYDCIMKPEFRKEYRDKECFFEMTDDFCSSDIILRRYVDHILKYISTSK